MQIRIDELCMCTNFGGHGLSSFRDFALFRLPSKVDKFPFQIMDYYIVHGVKYVTMYVYNYIYVMHLLIYLEYRLLSVYIVDIVNFETEIGSGDNRTQQVITQFLNQFIKTTTNTIIMTGQNFSFF